MAAADDQHVQRFAVGGQAEDLAHLLLDLRAYRVAGHHMAVFGHHLGMLGLGEGQGEARCPLGDHAVGPAKHGVLLMHQERQLQKARSHADRHGGIAPEYGDGQRLFAVSATTSSARGRDLV